MNIARRHRPPGATAPELASRPCLAGRRRPRRPRLPDARRAVGAGRRPTRSSTTRSCRTQFWRSADKAELIFAGKRGGRPSIAAGRHHATADPAWRGTAAGAAAEGRRSLCVRARRRGSAGAGARQASRSAFCPASPRPLAAWPSAGIPATMRGVNKADHPRHRPCRRHATTISTGRRSPGPASRSSIYMGLKNLAADRRRAASPAGLPADTPAAVVEQATTPRASASSSRTLATTLAEAAARRHAVAPALIVIGRIVVDARQELAERRHDARARSDHRRAALRLGQDQRHDRPAARAEAARTCDARRQVRARTISIPASTRRRPACPASTSTAGRCRPRSLDALVGASGRRRRHRRRRKRHGPVRRHSRAAGPLRLGRRSGAALRPAGAARARRLGPVADGGGRRQGLRDSTIRRCGSPASCSTGSAANGTAGWPATRSSALGLPVVGAILRDPSLSLPERHLGLVQAGEHADLDGAYRPPGRHDGAVARSRRGSWSWRSPFPRRIPDWRTSRRSRCRRPASASRWPQDAAFTFLYPHVRCPWRAAGAEIVPFSPLADEAPDESCDVCWLPGGYPELHAGRLAAAANFSRRHARIRGDEAGSWRVRRLHGAGRSAGGRRRRHAHECSACSATRPALPSAR